MTGYERRQEIVSIVTIRTSVRVGELAERLGVSDVTIRKDLSALEEMGLVVRTHGGVVLAEKSDEYTVLRARRSRNESIKHALARAALRLISHGETVFIDSGSTCAQLAPLVVDMDLRVVTNSLDVMVALANIPGIVLHSTGGNYRQGGGSFIGPFAEEMIRRMNFDHAFIGTTGLSWDGRFSSQNIIEAQTKRAVISAARSSVVLCDAGKIWHDAFSVFATAEDIDILITNLDDAGTKRLEATGLHVVSSQEEGE